MVVQRVFAHIANGIVKNIIVADSYELANMLARFTYGDEAIAVEVTNIPAGKGDKYYEGYFTRINEDGTETKLDPVPSAEKQISELERKMKYMMMMNNLEEE
jgi:hypothetical protein